MPLNSNMPLKETESEILSTVTERIKTLLPTDWLVTEARDAWIDDRRRGDLILTLTTPNKEIVRIVVEVKTSDDSRAILRAADQLEMLTEQTRTDEPRLIGLVAANFIGRSAQDRLRAKGIGFADLTGNTFLRADSPALFISTQGAKRNPRPTKASKQTLRGRGTATAMRALLENRPPYGLRELAKRTGASLATLSRVVALLERDDLLTRDTAGGIASLDWTSALQRWSLDYQVTKTNKTAQYLAARGITQLIEMLRNERGYAATGTLAIPTPARISPPRLVMLYATDVNRLAERLRLQPAETGANVLLLEPYDAVVFSGTRSEDGIIAVALTQAAADLLTSPGRGPSEGEALIDWMTKNEPYWRD